jgi:hypothetical protein
MIHAVLHFGMYFELRSTSKCDDILVAITPLTQAAFIIMQMIFIFSDNNKVRWCGTFLWQRALSTRVALRLAISQELSPITTRAPLLPDGSQIVRTVTQ